MPALETASVTLPRAARLLELARAASCRFFKAPPCYAFRMRSAVRKSVLGEDHLTLSRGSVFPRGSSTGRYAYADLLMDRSLTPCTLGKLHWVLTLRVCVILYRQWITSKMVILFPQFYHRQMSCSLNEQFKST